MVQRIRAAWIVACSQQCRIVRVSGGDRIVVELPGHRDNLDVFTMRLAKHRMPRFGKILRLKKGPIRIAQCDQPSQGAPTFAIGRFEYGGEDRDRITIGIDWDLSRLSLFDSEDPRALGTIVGGGIPGAALGFALPFGLGDRLVSTGLPYGIRWVAMNRSGKFINTPMTRGEFARRVLQDLPARREHFIVPPAEPLDALAHASQ